MKKLFYFCCLFVLTITSCEIENKTLEKLTPTVLNADQQKMRAALELTTNIMLDMISNDQNYFENLNHLILSGSPKFMEDRIMMKDLFIRQPKNSTSRIKADADRFTDDFKYAFANNRPLKISSILKINAGIFSNSDSLIQYLTDNNVSLYCPYPVENYTEDNRIPAITFHPMDNDSVNVGYLLDKNGDISTVNICQAYNELHPVWILMPYEREISSAANQQNVSKVKNTSGYEASVCRIYCKQYYGGIFDGDLDLHIIRANPASLTYDPNTNTYTGGITADLSFRMHRKYVTDAKKNWWGGWYVVNAVWDTNWDVGENSSLMYIYEWDKKGTEEESIPLNTYDSSGHVLANLGNVKYTAQSQNATIGLQEWSRYWFFGIINNGNPLWYWTHSSGNNYYEIDGDNIIRISPDFFMTMKIREY